MKVDRPQLVRGRNGHIAQCIVADRVCVGGRVRANVQRLEGPIVVVVVPWWPAVGHLALVDLGDVLNQRLIGSALEAHPGADALEFVDRLRQLVAGCTVHIDTESDTECTVNDHEGIYSEHKGS